MRDRSLAALGVFAYRPDHQASPPRQPQLSATTGIRPPAQTVKQTRRQPDPGIRGPAPIHRTALRGCPV